MTNNTYCKTRDIIHIEDLIDYAWRQAIKYRFDPIVGKIHADYLEMVKQMKIQINRHDRNDRKPI